METRPEDEPHLSPHCFVNFHDQCRKRLECDCPCHSPHGPV